jgi:hypothetical protein
MILIQASSSQAIFLDAKEQQGRMMGLNCIKKADFREVSQHESVNVRSPHPYITFTYSVVSVADLGVSALKRPTARCSNIDGLVIGGR